MNFLQMKPSYTDYYDHGIYNINNQVDKRCFNNINTMYKEKEVNCMKPLVKSNNNNNMRKDSCNNYLLRASPPPNIDDILNENLNCSDKLEFDFEEHILPPCFDTLINVENQLLASPDLHILKLADPDLDSLITEQETDTERMDNDDDSLTKGLQQENEIFQSFGQPNQHDQLLTCSNAAQDMNTRNMPDISQNNSINQNNIMTTMSEKEIQLIKEVNKTLDCILPIKKEDSDDELLDSDLNFDNELFEPLQQVPCLEDANLHPRNNRDYHRDLDNDYHRTFTNDYHHKNLANDYNRVSYNTDYHKHLYIKTEQDMENNFFLEHDDNSAPSFYDMIEEQVRHQKQRRENEGKISGRILDRYLPAEQDLIKRYIEGDKGHLPIPPINTEIQEIIKRERKKHKNRVAASKCRKKKLEREAQLEVRVNYLKERSVELNSVVRDLRNQATTLKQRIVEHINAGCTLNPNVIPSGINPYYV